MEFYLIKCPLRGETLVTKKVVRALCKIKFKSKRNYLLVIFIQKDWGHAEDYVIAMWKMLQQKILAILLSVLANNIQ